MSGQWAFCDRCQRWFYGDGAVTSLDLLHCPVCDASPTMVRAESIGSPVVQA